MTTSLFTSFFLAGFECSSHRRRDGVRLDLIAATGHDRFAGQDYAACAAHGIRTVRDGLRWHLIEHAPGAYDWSSWLPMLRAARDAGVRVIWDLYHYGSPDFYDIGHDAFIDAYAAFCAAATRLHREEMDEPPLFCPVNEISFFAWSVDTGYFPKGSAETGGAFKQRLVRIALAGVNAVRAEDDRARFLWAEPLIHVAPHNHQPKVRARAESYRLAQFEAYDMLMGRAAPELGGRPDVVDVIGLNFYPHNQWYYEGPTIPMGHHEYRAMADMLVEAWERYGKPMFIAETGAEGSGRPAWLHYVCDEVRAAQARGARIDGLCLYPVTAYPGWDNERHCDVGLFSTPDENGRRAVFERVAAEIARQRALMPAR
jgi:beta-glucosidase/6-phospho-beta-glucosidase/beta-galactosidase